ncbi:MAG: pyridoxal phosphate-dependent aminotransferase [Opitutales bacterium]|jgi:aspartate/methionine/tyrosine aminotransferase
MDFSARLPAVLDDNPLALAVAARRAAGQPIHDLTLSNPTRAGLAYPTAEIAAALAALAAGAASPYEPSPRGHRSARSAIAAYYNHRGPCAIDPDRLHLTASTSEAYSLLFKLLGDSGAEILAPHPSYPLIEHLAALDGWRARPYPLVLDSNAWRLDHAALATAVTPATRAIAVIHPHNPTGWLMRGGADAHSLLDLCASRNLALIADEVFLDYPAPGHEQFAQSFAAHEVSALTFTLGGLSKSCALPHLKLGWIHVGGPPPLVAAAQARLDFIADAYLSVATPVQAAAPRLLELGIGLRAQIQSRLAENFAALTLSSVEGLTPSPVEGPANATWPAGFQVLPRAAGWSALLRRPPAPDEELLARQLLDRAGVLAHPGYFFDFPEPGWHVLSLLPEPEKFRAALAALRDWLPRLV